MLAALTSMYEVSYSLPGVAILTAVLGIRQAGISNPGLRDSWPIPAKTAQLEIVKVAKSEVLESDWFLLSMIDSGFRIPKPKYL